MNSLCRLYAAITTPVQHAQRIVKKIKYIGSSVVQSKQLTLCTFARMLFVNAGFPIATSLASNTPDLSLSLIHSYGK